MKPAIQAPSSEEIARSRGLAGDSLTSLGRTGDVHPIAIPEVKPIMLTNREWGINGCYLGKTNLPTKTVKRRNTFLDFSSDLVMASEELPEDIVSGRS